MWIAITSLLISPLYASFCGDSSIPFSLEVLADGHPVLGCARPSCFGWSPNGKPISEKHYFYRIYRHSDGFIREGQNTVSGYDIDDPRYTTTQMANCERTFESSSCNGLTSWVGGIAPLLNVSEYGLVLQCCTYEPLKQSETRGTATLKPGQIFVGGEVESDGYQYAFDYIADVSKTVDEGGSVTYDVSVRRMPCIGSPTGNSGSSRQENVPRREEIRRTPEQTHNTNDIIGPDDDQPAPLGRSRYSSRLSSEDELSRAVPRPRAFQAPRPSEFEDGSVIEGIFREDAVKSSVPAPRQLQRVTPFNSRAAADEAAPIQEEDSMYYYPVRNVAFDDSEVADDDSSMMMMCFSGDMTVMMADGTVKRMDELQQYEYVLSSHHKVEYKQVKSWLHRLPSQKAVFHKITTEDGRTIKLTRQHYIYKGACEYHTDDAEIVPPEVAVFAENVTVGDCLYSVSRGGKIRQIEVVEVSLVEEVGVFAPMTTNGNIVVNGIHCSCHSVIQSHTLQHSIFGGDHYFNRPQCPRNTVGSIAESTLGDPLGTQVKACPVYTGSTDSANAGMHIERFHSMLRTLFGLAVKTEVNLPIGFEMLVDIFEVLLPSDLVTF